MNMLLQSKGAEAELGPLWTSDKLINCLPILNEKKRLQSV